MSWLKLAVLFLQLADKLADIAREKGQIKAGEDAAFGKMAASILQKTEIGKAIDLRAAGLGEAKVDEELKELEPK